MNVFSPGCVRIYVCACNQNFNKCLANIILVYFISSTATFHYQ